MFSLPPCWRLCNVTTYDNISFSYHYAGVYVMLQHNYDNISRLEVGSKNNHPAGFDSKSVQLGKWTDQGM